MIRTQGATVDTQDQVQGAADDVTMDNSPTEDLPIADESLASAETDGGVDAGASPADDATGDELEQEASSNGSGDDGYALSAMEVEAVGVEETTPADSGSDGEDTVVAEDAAPDVADASADEADGEASNEADSVDAMSSDGEDTI